jgi:hypothetical protein
MVAGRINQLGRLKPVFRWTVQDRDRIAGNAIVDCETAVWVRDDNSRYWKFLQKYLTDIRMSSGATKNTIFGMYDKFPVVQHAALIFLRDSRQADVSGPIGNEFCRFS